MHGKEPRARRSAEEPLVRGNRAGHAGAVCVRFLRRAHRVEALRHCALEVGVRDVDFRIDHCDRHVGAANNAVDIGNLELLQHVLRGISLRRVAARRWHWITRLLLQGVDVVRLRDCDELDGRKRGDDLGGAPSVGNAEAHHGRAGDGEVFGGEQRQPETADRGLQPLHRDIAGDLQHDLILDKAGLSGRRNVDDSPVKARRQLLLTPWRTPWCGWRRLLGRESDSAFHSVEQRRPGGVERGELRRTFANEVVDDQHRVRQRGEQVRREWRQGLGR